MYDVMTAITIDAKGKKIFLFIFENALPSLGDGAQPR
jgi:hypothetical protein